LANRELYRAMVARYDEDEDDFDGPGYEPYSKPLFSDGEEDADADDPEYFSNLFGFYPTLGRLTDSDQSSDDTWEHNIATPPDRGESSAAAAARAELSPSAAPTAAATIPPAPPTLLSVDAPIFHPAAASARAAAVAAAAAAAAHAADLLHLEHVEVIMNGRGSAHHIAAAAAAAAAVAAAAAAAAAIPPAVTPTASAVPVAAAAAPVPPITVATGNPAPPPATSSSSDTNDIGSTVLPWDSGANALGQVGTTL